MVSCQRIPEEICVASGQRGNESILSVELRMRRQDGGRMNMLEIDTTDGAYAVPDTSSSACVRI